MKWYGIGVCFLLFSLVSFFIIIKNSWKHYILLLGLTVIFDSIIFWFFDPVFDFLFIIMFLFCCFSFPFLHLLPSPSQHTTTFTHTTPVHRFQWKMNIPDKLGLNISTQINEICGNEIARLSHEIAVRLFCKKNISFDQVCWLLKKQINFCFF